MHKSALHLILLTALVITLLFSVAMAYAPIDVKRGDWIKYQVAVTGSPSPNMNITWARMDITGVKDETITINVQTGYANGTIYPENGITLNLATGAIGDGFFVPTNLNPGDNYSTEYEGNITITNVEQIEAGGAKRTVLQGATSLTTYDWDSQTGIMVAATSKYPDYTMRTETSGTDLWQPQILGLDQSTFYGVVVAVAVAMVIIVAVVFLVRRANAHAMPYVEAFN